jgi:predicted GNAT superfamily acetyltransferase
VYKTTYSSITPSIPENWYRVNPMADSALNIRILSTIADYHQAEVVQRHAWNIIDATSVIPVHLLLTAQKNGGLVAGTFDNSGKMLGMLFGFLGLTHEGKVKHCSHIMGISPEAQRQNVGYALKRFQRDFVHKQGLDLITWTFDPLEGVNASLNVGKLGVTIRSYYPNLYGDGMADALNTGLPTDRFEVEWWINSEHVRQFVDQPRQRPTHTALLDSGAQIINQTHLDEMGALRPLESQLTLSASTLLVEVPPEFQAIKIVSMDLAREWRTQTQEIFEHYFANGYAVTDFITDRVAGYRRNFYLLSQANTINLVAADSASLP